MRPGTMDKLGFDVESLLKVNPGLVIGKIVHDGDARDLVEDEALRLKLLGI